MLLLGLMLAFCFVITFALIPVLIDVSKIKRLFDEPLEYRKVHFSKIPNLGGVALFTAILLGTCLFVKPGDLNYLNAFIASAFIIAIIGVKDDLVGIAPDKKFFAQIIIAFVMIYFGNVRITSFHGFVGINELSLPFSVIITGLVIVFITNALNLIDGIDGLAGGIGLTASIIYAICFYRIGSIGECVLSVGMAGSLLAFLYYNVSPAKIFMGDCGSLLLGFILSILSIRFMELNSIIPPGADTLPFFASPAIAISILGLPIYDTLRLFSLRIIKLKSPFAADNNHLHHWLIVSFRFTHIQASRILVALNLLLAISAFFFSYLGSTKLILLVLAEVATFNIVLWRLKKMTKAKVISLTSDHHTTKRVIELDGTNGVSYDTKTPVSL